MGSRSHRGLCWACLALACLFALPYLLARARAPHRGVRRRVCLSDSWALRAVSLGESGCVRALAVATDRHGPSSGELMLLCGDLASPTGDGIPLPHEDWHGEYRSPFAFAPDGSVLAHAGLSFGAWGTRDGECRWATRPTDCERSAVAFAADGRLLAAATGSRGAVALYSLQDGSAKHILEPAGRALFSVALSPDGRSLAGGSYVGRVTVWNVAGGNIDREYRLGTRAIWALAFSPDGGTLAAAGAEHVVRLRPASGEGPACELVGHTDFVNALAFSPDGARLASAGDDGTVRLWSLPSGRPERVLKGHAGPVNCLAFSRDGALLASGDDEGMLLVWDVGAL